MNKTHGMVASAWLLGGGLLMNVSLTANAQENAAQDEFLTPQRSGTVPSKKAPRLLPEIIRNADVPKVDGGVRPKTSANHSLNADRKFNTMQPTASRPVNRSAVTTASNLPKGVTIQTVNEQSEAAPSPIQKQLEELYRKDGRPVPPMNFNQTPIPADGQIPAIEGAARPNVVAPSNVVPPKPRSFFDKLNPFSRNRAAPAPLPQHAASPIPNNAARILKQPAPMANGVNPAGANQVPGNRIFNNAARAMPTPQGAQPAPVTLPQANSSDNQLSDTLPPVPGDPGYRGTATKILETVPIPPAPASLDEAIENAFSDKAEEQVEVKSEVQSAPKAESKSIEIDNPFSGLSLDDEDDPASKPATPATKPAKTPADEESSVEESAPKLSIENEIPLSPAAKQPEAAKPEIKEPAKEEVDAKMKLIAERGELRGLKGFCPVMLRDERDLKNALPEHHSTYKGRTYYFSSADAKVAFDENPQQYAPISGGQDAVLLKQKVTKEGSLDHAVWFKDRLYFFTSQKTLEQFVATPKEFAISE